MKRLLLINSVCGIGSTGKICSKIAHQYESKGYEVKIAYGRTKRVSEDSRKYAVRIGTFFDVCIHALFTLIFDKHGLGSKRSTIKFIKWAEEFNPDILWLHNIHGFFINYEILFEWIKTRPNMEIKWTLHDCWSFTGHCSHFLYSGCEKWKTGCYKCPSKREYPPTLLFDNSKNNYNRKKKAFSGIKNLELITPSAWLANLTRESFLRDYPVTVINNTVNTEIFKKTESSLRAELNLQEKKVILAVASPWTERKGLFDLLLLSELLNKNFAIVIIGLTEKQITKYSKKIYSKEKLIIEKQNLLNSYDNDICYVKKIDCNYVISKGIKSIYQIFVKLFKDDKAIGRIIGEGAEKILLSRTDSQKTLAQYYSMADYFINPTYEDNFPTVNLEARACGTPVITYDTGGCTETLETVIK